MFDSVEAVAHRYMADDPDDFEVMELPDKSYRLLPLSTAESDRYLEEHEAVARQGLAVQARLKTAVAESKHWAKECVALQVAEELRARGSEKATRNLLTAKWNVTELNKERRRLENVISHNDEQQSAAQAALSNDVTALRTELEAERRAAAALRDARAREQAATRRKLTQIVTDYQSGNLRMVGDLAALRAAAHAEVAKLRAACSCGGALAAYALPDPVEMIAERHLAELSVAP